MFWKVCSAFAAVFSVVLSCSFVLLPQAFERGSPEARAVPTTINPDFTLTASPSIALVGQEIIFFANATSDIPAAALTFTIFYDAFNLSGVNENSAVTVNTTSSPGLVIVRHIYATTGNFSVGGNFFFFVQLFVFDGVDNQTTNIMVFVNFNKPPEFRSPPPDPLFTYSGTNATIATYIDDPDGDMITVFWDFGDGTNRTNVTVAPSFPGGVYVNQSHTWSPKIPGNPDYIDYWLNVTLSDGVNLPVKSVTKVNVSLPLNLPPTFELMVSPTTVNPLQQVNVNANASDPEGDPLTWMFNFSDGTIHVFHTDWSTPGELIWQNVTHAFASTGNYTVNASVSDALLPYQVSYHNVSRLTNIEVKANVPPLLTIITLNLTSPEINTTKGYVDVNCSIDAIDTDGDMITLTWSLNGVVIGTNTSAVGETEFVKYVHVIRFIETGTYNISVTVTDGRPGHELQRYKVVNVTSNNLPPAVVAFNHDPYLAGDFATSNETVRFRLVATDPERDTLELTWDFGDGSPQIYMNLTEYIVGNVTAFVNHTYSNPGFFKLYVNLSDNMEGILNHSISCSIQVSVVTDMIPPIADAGENQSALPGAFIIFNGAGSYDSVHIVNYTWSFVYNGSIQLLYGPYPHFVFWTEGIYEVNLKVTDYGGNSNSSEVFVTVANAIPEFPAVAFPVLGIILLVILGWNRRALKASSQR